jgi:5S rRNA maturation endonuclease (ribonuclease M5)
MSQTLTKMKKTKSNSYDQAKLKLVCDHLCDNIDDLLNSLDLEYKSTGKMITMSCPIHGGDNKSALNLYPDGEVYRGNWKCRTHGCEKYFKSSIIGFIRGVLSNKKFDWIKEGDKVCSFDEALKYGMQFLDKDFDSIKISKTDRDKAIFAGLVNSIKPVQNIYDQKISRHNIRKSLIMPAEYFLSRGFNNTVLNKYDVGLCNKSDKEMYNRIVVPIYDDNYKFMTGCSGRSIFEKCDSCNSYHSSEEQCPRVEDRWKYPKWKHNTGFQAQNHLYNYWFAKHYIKETKVAIIVESPGNVWKLEECGIRNSVAIFGSSMSDRQKMILDTSGAMELILLLDNDAAGIEATKKIIEKCKKTYNIHVPNFVTTDIADTDCSIIIDNLKNITNIYDD